MTLSSRYQAIDPDHDTPARGRSLTVRPITQHQIPPEVATGVSQQKRAPDSKHSPAIPNVAPTTMTTDDDDVYHTYDIAPRTGPDRWKRQVPQSVPPEDEHSVAPAHKMPGGDTTVLSTRKILHGGAQCPCVRSDSVVAKLRPSADIPIATTEIGPSTSVSNDLGALVRTAEPGGKRQSTEETVECSRLQRQCASQRVVESNSGMAKDPAITEDPGAPTFAEKLPLLERLAPFVFADKLPLSECLSSMHKVREIPNSHDSSGRNQSLLNLSASADN